MSIPNDTERHETAEAHIHAVGLACLIERRAPTTEEITAFNEHHQPEMDDFARGAAQYRRMLEGRGF